jgi:formate transporter
MTFSGRSLNDKIMVTILPVAMFVSAGFEHCIANMFQVPMAIAIKTFAPIEFWQSTGSNPLGKWDGLPPLSASMCQD